MAALIPESRSARWVTGLFLAIVVLQRFTVPGLPVSLLVAVASGWVVLALARGVVEADPQRLLLWVAAAGATAAAALAQTAFASAPLISVTSWSLFMATWLPFVFRLRSRSLDDYRQALRGVTLVGEALAAVCVVFIAVQLAGVPYRDVLGERVPATFLQQGFVITYPIQYGSPIYRSNAWIGLEPSTTSYLLGVSMLAGVLVGARLRSLSVIVAGLLCCASGSGFAILAVGMAILAVTGGWRRLRPFAVPGLVLVVVVAATPFGRALFARVDDFADPGSSGSLRSVLPYIELVPNWLVDSGTVLLGRGAGSSQDLATATGISGLIVASPIKVFFDYGLLAGSVLLVFLVACYLRGPSWALSGSMAASLWLLQPGTTLAVVVFPLLALVTLWSPRPGAPVERGVEEPAGACVSRVAGVPAVPR